MNSKKFNAAMARATATTTAATATASTPASGGASLGRVWAPAPAGGADRCGPLPASARSTAPMPISGADLRAISGGSHSHSAWASSNPHLPTSSGNRRSIALLFEAVAATALLGALIACGGGGGGGSPVPPSPPAPVPTPSAVPIPAVMSVPTPVGYDDDHLAAFNHLNQIRLAAGLGMLAQDTRLDEAAQAHADWEVTNNSYSHEEVAGTPGFTGVEWWQRGDKFGYFGHGGDEVIAASYQPTQAVDAWANSVYHREAILNASSVDIGIGWSTQANSNVSLPIVFDMTIPSDDAARYYGQSAQNVNNGVIVWPIDGAQGVFTHMGSETPNPVPTSAVDDLGTPASISVDPWKRIAIVSFTMTEVATGFEVNAVQLSTDKDPNQFIGQEFAALVPLEGLKQNTSYRVDFSGTLSADPFTTTQPFSRTWFFTTGATEYPPTN